MDFKDLLKNIISDVQVDLTQEFDRNFERKAFFDERWKTSRHHNSRGSQMLRTGRLRNSINHTKSSSEIRWKSSLPYARIHNEGGDLIVTKKMKSFFWAMYYKSRGAVQKGGNKKRNEKLSGEALKWKALALQKEGAIMKIEKRQFIGEHPILKKRIDSIVKSNMKEFNRKLIKK
ncbi:phage virion morphogenesis protein [Tenacibaculum maritimum]|nr:phage virion morphogenesis protein [Tenacibaculum maritimum]MDB0611264.1 phage virion morphogenesis protein [Tenacibaculum maritimum]